MIQYRTDLTSITPSQLSGFFEGWPRPPSPEKHLEVLRGSTHCVLAYDAQSDVVVGFVTALSDGVQNAYIPLLEVLPGHRGQGIGRELVRRVLQPVGDLYSVGLHCDADLEAFYAPFGLRPLGGMVLRNHSS